MLLRRSVSIAGVQLQACTCTQGLEHLRGVRWFADKKKGQRKPSWKPKKPKPKRTRGDPTKKKRIKHAIIGGKTLEEHEELAAKFSKPWDMQVASVAERYPIIMRDLKPWEEAYYEMKERKAQYTRKEYPAPLWQLDDDDEGDAEEEVKPNKSKQKQKDDDDEFDDDFDDDKKEGGDEDDLVILDDEDEDEGLEFVPAPRVTEADETNDRTSLMRALQHRLFLIQKNPTDAEPRMGGDWKFVGGDLPEGMMMQKAAIKHVNDQCIHGVESVDLGEMDSMRENGLQLFSITNAPVGFLALPYSEKYAAANNVYGCKLLTTDILECKVGDDGKSFLWVTKDELHEYFDEEVCHYLRLML